MSTAPVYPIRVEADLGPHLSRWLWLVKWLLAIPHYVVLAILWIAFVPLTLVALVAILVTGRYPRALFDFNVGVLRWTWRVGFYSCSALGTDRYPPFTLGEAPDYPATLEVVYPERLSRGLALVKWWLLALPHYLVVGIFVGGGTWVAWEDESWRFAAGGGLIGLLVLVAAVVLLFSGRYPRSVFDFVLGLNRWVLRVVAYAALLTDAYPPFRLDLGGHEPGVVQVPPAAPPAVPAAAPAEPAPRTGWTGGSILLTVLGSLAALLAAALLLGGGALVVIDQTQRDDQGFLMTPTRDFSSAGFAIVSETVDVAVDGPDWVAGSFVGDVKIRSESPTPVFVGIARASEVAQYLGGVRRSVVTDLGPDVEYDQHSGGAPSSAPAEQGFWVASTSGSGTQSLTWDPADGDWSVVAMNADGSSGVAAELSIGAELDPLLWIGIGVLVGGAILALLGAALITSGVRRASR